MKGRFQTRRQYVHYKFVCSQCGVEIKMGDEYWSKGGNYNYCLNCHNKNVSRN